MDQIPDRPLPDGARARRRAELMEAVAPAETRTRRWLVPAAAAAVVAGLVGGGYALTSAGDDDTTAPRPARSLQVASGGTDTPTETPSTSTTPACDDITTAELEKSMRRLARRPVWEDPRVAPWLASYREIVARHLDPRGQHLQREVSGVQLGGSPRCGLSALGTKLGWTVAGEDGQGMVQVEVDRSRQGSQVEMMFDHWAPLSATGTPGVVRAESAHDGNRFAVLVERTDGLVVGIIADPLFGNNSLTPVSGFDFSVDDLLATAADEELALPPS